MTIKTIPAGYTPMSRIDVVNALLKCYWTSQGTEQDYCAGCPYCDKENGTCASLAPLFKDALYYILETKDVMSLQYPSK